MSKEWVELLVAMVIALPGILGLLMQFKSYKDNAIKTQKETNKLEEEAEKLKKESRKVEMETMDNFVDTALSLNTPLKEENKRLLTRNKYLERGCKILIKQLKAVDIEPDFDPSNGNGDGNQNGSS